jgi:hypothetical protein
MAKKNEPKDNDSYLTDSLSKLDEYYSKGYVNKEDYEYFHKYLEENWETMMEEESEKDEEPIGPCSFCGKTATVNKKMETIDEVLERINAKRTDLKNKMKASSCENDKNHLGTELGKFNTDAKILRSYKHNVPLEIEVFSSSGIPLNDIIEKYLSAENKIDTWIDTWHIIICSDCKTLIYKMFKERIKEIRSLIEYLYTLRNDKDELDKYLERIRPRLMGDIDHFFLGQDSLFW